jgi:presenilin-like A22 family membrane protease
MKIFMVISKYKNRIMKLIYHVIIKNFIFFGFSIFIFSSQKIEKEIPLVFKNGHF